MIPETFGPLMLEDMPNTWRLSASRIVKVKSPNHVMVKETTVLPTIIFCTFGRADFEKIIIERSKFYSPLCGFFGETSHERSAFYASIRKNEKLYIPRNFPYLIRSSSKRVVLAIHTILEGEL